MRYENEIGPVHMNGRRLQSEQVFCVALSLCVILLGACSDPSAVDEDPVILWQIPSGRALTAPLILESQIVIGGGDGKIVAVDRQTGARRWTRQLATNVFQGNVILGAAGLVIVPQYELWGLEPNTGRPRWQFGGPDGAAGTHDPAVVADTVFAVSALGWVSKVDARTGEALWSTDLEESPFPPAVSDDLVIVGTRGFLGGERQGPLGAGHVVALRRSDGSEAWRFPLPDSAGFDLSGGAVTGGVVWQDRVIVPAVASRAYALRLTDGTLLWEHASGASPVRAGYYRAPTIIGDIVVLTRDDGVVEGRDAESGDIVWTLNRPLGGVTTPVTVGPFAYLFDGPISVVDAAGEVRWEHGGLELTSGRSFWRANVSSDGIIYTLGNEHPLAGGRAYLYALDPPVKPQD